MQILTTGAILCIFGFLKEFRPNEPFITDYLTGPWKNFTDHEVMEIYPIATYSNAATLIVIFFITDMLRYKPIIILCGLTGVVTFTILTFGSTIAAIQTVEFFYGLYMSTEIAYYTYIYAKVDRKHYQEVTSHTRSALLLGRFATGLVAQLLITFHLLDYHLLNYLTIFGQVLALIWSFFLPSVGQSLYFHKANNKNEEFQDIDISNPHAKTFENSSSKEKLTMKKIRQAYYLLWQDFIKAFKNLEILKWSLWWTVASGGYLQVLSYSQVIWRDCVGENEDIYNGAVEAIYPIIGAIVVFGVGKLRLNWVLAGGIILPLFSYVQAIFLFIVSRSHNIWLQYIIYIAFGVVYHAVVTICSSEVAKRISDDSFGFIYGINVFFGLIFGSFLAFLVTSQHIFVLDIRVQFAVYGGYFTVLGLIFTIISIFTFTRLYKTKEKQNWWLSANNEPTHNL